ncbi:hypothetical protein KI688_004303 [Linnemannia hyalina]|uniref:PROP1-like PPR domain-containing protein n=1 Tax=Linnemannia hyalina TaxID=64524 RepID=A0A9P7XL87_9FUNG|nr:hypothetical protein KI688_004303 [Linnemannia hyalina]
MLNLKSGALLGALTRQSVSKQLLPLSSPKNQVISLTHRSTQPVSANAPSNPVRSFSSTQASRENSSNNHNSTVNNHPFYNTNGTGTNAQNTIIHHKIQASLNPSLKFHQSQQHSKHGQPHTPTSNSTKPPKHDELSKIAWEAINGQDARAIFTCLQEMQHQGVYADAALSTRIVAQFLDMNNPQDAERALVMLVDCHHTQGRSLSVNQKNIYTSLAKDIANHSSDFLQTLSLAKLLDRHGLLASAGFADGALRSYRELKVTSGLSVVRAMLSSTDIETLLTLQATLTKTYSRYKKLIEILLDAKEMNIIPSWESCSKISLSFVQLGDYSGQLAWDTAVQEIYPGFQLVIPEDFTPGQETTLQSTTPRQQSSYHQGQSPDPHTHQQHHPVPQSSKSQQYQQQQSLSQQPKSQHQPQHQSQSQPQQQHQHQHQPCQQQGLCGCQSEHNNGSRNRRKVAPNPSAPVLLRNGDPSEHIIRACKAGYAAVALEEIDKMMKQDQLPSPQALADTIQVCAKREKERATNYNKLYHIALRSIDAIRDRTHRRAAEYEVYNAMLVANATLGDMTSAKKNYDDIVQLGQFPDATGYATLLIATTTGAVDEALDALKILEEVKRHNIKPNIFFYNVVIGKLSRGRKIERVLEVYDDMIKHDIRPNAITYGTLISACTRVGSEEMARNLFKEMTASPKYKPRQGPHNAMIQFYVRQKKDREAALDYYDDMLRRKLSPTEHTYTLLIEAFACIQPYDLSEANRLIQSLRRGPVRASEAHFSALIHAYGVEHRDVSTAISVFGHMRQSGIVPKGPAYQSLIESYIANGDVRRAVEVRNELLASGQPSSTYIENTLIRGFGQANDIDSAEEIFRSMKDPYGPKNGGAIVKEPSTFQSMVSAYLENDMVERAYGTLGMMRSQHYPELVVKPVEEAIAGHTAALSSHGCM